MIAIRSLRGAALATLFAAACAHAEDKPAPPPATTIAAPPAPASSPAAVLPPASSPAAVLPAATPASASAASPMPAATAEAATPTPAATALPPPAPTVAAPPALITHVSGCLAETTPEGGAKFALPRSAGMQPPKDEVKLSRVWPTLSIAHKLAHACCLHVQTSEMREGPTLVIREVLSGDPCRCMCSSQLDFTVAPSDATTLRIETKRGTGLAHTAFTGPIPAP